MIRQSDPTGEGETLALPRLFLREPGWKVGHKHDSQREFCFQVHPGDDSHHRLAVGELFVYSPDERLCLPCADRRGLIQFEPLALRNPIAGRSVTAAELSEEDSIPVLDRFGIRSSDEHEPPSLRQ